MDLPFNEIRNIGKSWGGKGTDNDFSFGHVNLKWYLDIQIELSSRKVNIWMWKPGQMKSRWDHLRREYR